mmetsp:Transcript_4124/g.3450  ORF Transcript_4124/g.3450 Transcript_4124/m.3450 type:complete len:121 (+) Transcript_4124:85-447(+)
MNNNPLRANSKLNNRIDSHSNQFESVSLKTLKGSKEENKLSSERPLQNSIRILLRKAIKMRKESNSSLGSFEDLISTNSCAKINQKFLYDKSEVRMNEEENNNNKPLVTMGDIDPSNIEF